LRGLCCIIRAGCGYWGYTHVRPRVANLRLRTASHRPVEYRIQRAGHTSPVYSERCSESGRINCFLWMLMRANLSSRMCAAIQLVEEKNQTGNQMSKRRIRLLHSSSSNLQGLLSYRRMLVDSRAAVLRLCMRVCQGILKPPILWSPICHDHWFRSDRYLSLGCGQWAAGA
jgi:hypothetical protein